MDINSNDLISIGDRNTTLIKVIGIPGATTFLITVISGTLKVGSQPDLSASYPWPVGKVQPISCLNGGALYVQQGGNSDTWVASII